jgi:hypothetical protein
MREHQKLPHRRKGQKDKQSRITQNGKEARENDMSSMLTVPDSVSFFGVDKRKRA